MTSVETIPAGDCFGDLKACPACLGDARECPRPWPEPGPLVDCLLCHGDDIDCPAPHIDDPIWPDDAPPPTLEELEERYGSADAPAAECLACFGGNPECPLPHGDSPLIIWKEYEIMPIFNSGLPSYQTTATVDTTLNGIQIYSTTGTNGVDFPAGTTLGALTIMNTGTVTCYYGQSGVSASTGTPLKPGEQVTIRGVGHVAKETGSTSWNLYAITASGSTSITASLDTVDGTV